MKRRHQAESTKQTVSKLLCNLYDSFSNLFLFITSIKIPFRISCFPMLFAILPGMGELIHQALEGVKNFYPHFSVFVPIAKNLMNECLNEAQL